MSHLQFLIDEARRSAGLDDDPSYAHEMAWSQEALASVGPFLKAIGLPENVTGWGRYGMTGNRMVHLGGTHKTTKTMVQVMSALLQGTSRWTGDGKARVRKMLAGMKQDPEVDRPEDWFDMEEPLEFRVGDTEAVLSWDSSRDWKPADKGETLKVIFTRMV